MNNEEERQNLKEAICRYALSIGLTEDQVEFLAKYFEEVMANV